MRGFDPEFVDLPDYIVKITERIWEGRGLGLIRRWYAADCLMHTSMGPARGVPTIIAATLDTLNTLPDRRLLPEDVVWSGDDEAGFLSSHRLIAPGTHLGHSLYGPPTGAEISVRAIADCACLDNQIFEEWLVRDSAGIAAQIGVDPDMVARRYAEAETVRGGDAWHLAAARQLRDEGQFREAVLTDDDDAVRVREGLEAAWGHADLDRVADLYAPGVTVFAPGNLALHGYERLWRWLFGLLAAVPDLKLVVEHSIALGTPGHKRVATRWWATGTHDGHGRFGSPSGATILLLGITHSTVVDGRIVSEYIVADEIAVRKQIALKRGW